jgi:hypothetical protein
MQKRRSSKRDPAGIVTRTSGARGLRFTDEREAGYEFASPALPAAGRQRWMTLHEDGA